jgi:hypothetical protein
MLSNLQKARIRYHLGLPYAGTPLSSETLGLRTVTRAGELEAYMNLMQPEEEAILLGTPYAAAQLYYPLTAGQTIIFTIGITAVTYTIQPSDLVQPSALFSILSNLANLINAQSLFGVVAVPGRLQSDQVMPGQPPAFGQLFVTSATLFNASFTGTANISQTANGTFLPPPQLVTLSPGPGDPLVINGVLPICDALETSFMSVDQRLSFTLTGSNSTGQVIFNKMEMRQRASLYRSYVRRMAVLLAFTVNDYPGKPSGWGLNQ